MSLFLRLEKIKAIIAPKSQTAKYQTINQIYTFYL
jgi:hypothetical protein